MAMSDRLRISPYCWVVFDMRQAAGHDQQRAPDQVKVGEGSKGEVKVHVVVHLQLVGSLYILQATEWSDQSDQKQSWMAQDLGMGKIS